ncbi:MAG: RdgB/HAM1 family non-canonical purine NTP pyrophosphatase [Candidatus Aminicenantes bacterium]|nr:RdgB/HAM1 family non-canonical purine NTP pyrophosphatase [Candidatus Aminicenantes bacterium]
MKPARTPLVVATGNAGKAREIAIVLKDLPFRVLSLADLGLAADYEETGLTFAANARGKAEFYSALTGHLTLADDSGLAVDALNGAPGVVSARFSGPGSNDARNNRELLRHLAAVPESRRGARFICCMVLARDGRAIKQVTGRVRGRILREPRGRHGFGYDPVFFYRRLGRTFAELSGEVKNGFSHRGRALRKMASYLAEK